ncbi:hypothetical protein OEZ86_010941 [Tetradesmus obliquus]|nr:hypothetical protein OEZ86_010941 [Tetradesmus obliquus]
MDASLVLDTVYSSDDFRLYCHKVLPCAKRTPHDWASCPFAHPGEKAKRRNIRTHYYSADMCVAVSKGEECKLGSGCPNSHNVFESFLHPQKYRTMMCKDRDKCSRPVCFFAHSPDELRQPTDQQQQQQQVVPGHYGYQQGVAVPATQALQGPGGPPLYFLQ